MKFTFKQFLAVLLAGLLLLSVVSCSTPSGNDTNTGDGTTPSESNQDGTIADVGAETEPDKVIERTDYNAVFTIIGSDEMMPTWLVADMRTGDPLDDAIYERGLQIDDHLGVELVMVPGGAGGSYADEILLAFMAGDDAYQLVAAACHNGVNTLITSGAMLDFNSLDAINLDAPYWSKSIMEEYLINGTDYLVGYNDFCLANAACLVFNKDLAAEYSLKAPYDDVRNMKWTMDTMASWASVVAKDNGDGAWTIDDTYGITCDGQIDYISLNTAMGIKMVARDADGIYHVAYNDNPDKMVDYLDKLDRMDRAEYSFFGKPQTELQSAEASFMDGHALIRMQTTGDLPAMRGSRLRFGILPYPMYDEAQGAYKALNWNGMLMIPSTIQEEKMVGEVVELLAYYSEPVKEAFFQDLLGMKLADAPDDAQMLNIIWEAQTNDICLAASADYALGNIIYLVPFICRDGVQGYASFLAANVDLANQRLEELFNPGAGEE